MRSTFKLALPNLSTIKDWFTNVDAEPGFTGEAFNILKERVDVAKENGKKILLCLSIDEMSIKKNIQVYFAWLVKT